MNATIPGPDRPRRGTRFTRRGDSSHRVFWSITAIVLSAAALRVAASGGEFWIDEIFSWQIARSVSGALDLFTRVHNDNNHHLNTLWMYLAGDRWHWQIYRAPAIIAGTLSVALMAVLARQSGKAASIIACVFAAASYFLVQCSSEARGYAPAMMFTLACVWLMRVYLATPRRRLSLAFGACAILGALSHLTFVYVFAGLAAWSIVAIASDATLTRARRLRHLVRLHAVPATFLAVFYVIEVSQMRTAGGPVYPAWGVVADTFAWAMGGPRGGIGLCGVIAAVIAIYVAEIIAMRRRGEREWVLYLISVAIAPAGMLLLWKQPYLYPRYFLLCVPLVYLLLARFLGRLWDRPGARRAACVLGVGLFLIGNAIRFDAFFTRGGRGQYLQAMRFMIDQSHGPTTVGSTQDSRNEAMFAFYRKHLPAGATLEYIPRARYSASSPDWMIVESIEGARPNAQQYTTRRGARYRLARKFQCSGLSGFDWYVMRIDGGNLQPATTSRPTEAAR